jgi:hypothetical protein
MAQQQQLATLDPVTQKRWDDWADGRVDIGLEVIREDLNELADEAGAASGRHAQKIFEVLEIMQVLAVGNDFLRGRIDQLTREFKHQNGIEHKAIRTIERTTKTEEEHTSKVSQVVSVIESILAE